MKIQHQTIHLMHSPTISETRSILADTIKRSELDICKALIGHYVSIEEHNQRALNEINRKVEQLLRRKPPQVAKMYEIALEKLERVEDNTRNLLAERRNKKLLRLASHKDPLYPHTHKDTHSPQATTPGKRTLGHSLFKGNDAW